ncbi:DoxX family membrane protein [Chryseobacterium taichungense]|uniref:DoxX family membrane protein n=1 Tax=Chryseobacterium taichungense TaxID=295069 RepID=UPI0028A91A61|nr:DoxX family membrane protein [Chryseobacterium taichungense]
MRFEKLRTNTFNQWIIIHLRYLLGFAFFPSGLVKVMGERFTRVSTSEPIGYFFEALYQSGFYWNFLGLTQVFAGILLMTQRFATLGALVFLAILSNIWIITLSLSFQGTWIITSLMMIAILVLLIWDKHKILPLLSYNKLYLVEQYSDPDRLWIISGSIYAICFISLQLLGPASANVVTRLFSLFLGVVILITFFTSNIMAYRKRKLLLNN